VNRRTDTLTTIIGLILAAGLVVLLVTYKHELDLEQAARTRDVTALAKQVENLGGTPVVEPGPPGVQGVPGERGPAPTDEQVRAAVVTYLLANPPASGRPPTDTEITAAVAIYCGANNCRGDRGFDGNDGVNGTDGAQGPGPTDEQVINAVTTFCAANNGCVGPKGDKGDPGDPATACPVGSSQQTRSAPPPYLTETWTVCVQNP
jgi:hypothetical protein